MRWCILLALLCKSPASKVINNDSTDSYVSAMDNDKQTSMNEISLNSTRQHHRKARAATSQTTHLWPGGIIPFEFAHNYSGRFLEMIYESMHTWSESSCVFFAERTGDHRSWLRIAPGRCGCCSQVGMQGSGPQDLHISSECDRVGIIAHEMGHALGFWHEHTRPDRDDYIYVIDDNIESDQFYNFEKKSFDDVDSLGEPYDSESIMHYGPYTFAKLFGDFTILLRYGLDDIDRERFVEAMSRLGQRIRPSEGDISQLNKLYRCPPCGGNIRLQNTGHWTIVEPKEDIVDCRYCRWRVITSQGNRIGLRIENIKIFPGQFAVIYDGPERNFSKLIGYVNGYQKVFKPSLVSKQSAILVELWSTDVYRQQIPGSKFKLAVKASCGGIFTENIGVITNPGFPFSTTNTTLSCTWSIYASSGYNIFITVKRLLLKEADPCVITNAGCTQLCEHTSNGYVCKCDIGYRLKDDKKTCFAYKSIDAGSSCKRFIRLDRSHLKGTIRNPLKGDKSGRYGNNLNCFWMILAPKHRRIKLRFRFMEIEGMTGSCLHDRLTIKDFVERQSTNNQSIVLCGKDHPTKPIISSANLLNISFVTDSTNCGRGFHLEYSIV